jgi:hypothetical protein
LLSRKSGSVWPAADILCNGFRYGVRINYAGPRLPYESRNLTSVLNNLATAWGIFGEYLCAMFGGLTL